MLFDGLVGVDAFGDIAVDDILISRLEDAALATDPALIKFELPIYCDFRVISRSITLL